MMIVPQAYESLVRNAHLLQLHRKLLNLQQVCKQKCASSAALLVHVYTNQERNTLLVAAKDPFFGTVLTYSADEDTSLLPYGDKLKSKFPKLEPVFTTDRGAEKIASSPCCYLFNAVDTPAENKAVEDFIGRLRIKASLVGSELALTEDENLIRSIRSAVEEANLPFFSTINEFQLSFEVSSSIVKTEDESMQKNVKQGVLKSIRDSPGLLRLLMSIRSTLLVRFASYDGTSEELLDWAEFESYLSDFRNPFVTVELFPKPITLADYSYTKKTLSSNVNEVELDDVLGAQRGSTSFYGGPASYFSDRFKFPFQPPKLSSCPILSTDIAKFKIDGAFKYVVVIVRQGRGESAGGGDFRFLTVYDSRAATEYQCGTAESSKLFRALQSSNSSIDELMTLLATASENEELILGPAITPRVVLNVYNQRGRLEDWIGSCEISISSVLSGTGVSSPRWCKLLSRDGVASAGFIEVELSFRREVDIKAEIKSAGAFVARKMATAAALRIEDSPIQGDQTSGGVENDNGVHPSTSNLKSKKELILNAAVKEPLKGRTTDSITVRPDAEAFLLLKQTNSQSLGVIEVGDAPAVSNSSKELDTLRDEVLRLQSQLEIAMKQKREPSSEPQRSLPKRVASNSTIADISAAISPIPDLDSSLEGIIKRIRDVFAARNDPGLTALLRLLKGSAIEGWLNVSAVQRCFMDLLVTISSDQCDLLLRHVGLSGKGLVKLPALVDFFVNSDRLVLGSTVLPKKRPQSASSARSKVMTSPDKPTLDTRRSPNPMLTMDASLGVTTDSIRVTLLFAGMQSIPNYNLLLINNLFGR